MPIGAGLASHPVVVGDGGGSTKGSQHAKLRVGDEGCSAVTSTIETTEDILLKYHYRHYRCLW